MKECVLSFPLRSGVQKRQYARESQEPLLASVIPWPTFSRAGDCINSQPFARHPLPTALRTYFSPEENYSNLYIGFIKLKLCEMNKSLILMFNLRRNKVYRPGALRYRFRLPSRRCRVRFPGGTPKFDTMVWVPFLLKPSHWKIPVCVDTEKKYFWK